MCLIVDTNAVSSLVNKDDSGKPVLSWLKSASAHLAVGGTKLGKEYAKVGDFVGGR